MLRKLLPYLLLIIFCVPAIFPLLQPGFFQSDDGDWMIIRLSAFHQTLRAGQFPVRFLERLNHGYGYPVMDFLYPLPFYLGEVVHLLGFNFVDTVKILLAGSFLVGAAFMYLWISSEWGSFAGMVAALFYTYFPYKVFDVYKRGSLGEAIAFIFLPLIFYFLQRLYETGKRRHLALAVLSLAALITAHNVIALLFLPIILSCMALKTYQVSSKKRSLIINHLSLITLALGASAFFWLPALYDLQFTKAGSIQVSNFPDYFLIYGNFLNLIGPLTPLIVLIALPILWGKSDKIVFILFGLILISLFIASPLSIPIWQFSPLPRLVQFPWRFLAITAFSTAILIAYLVRKLRPIFLILLIFLTLLTSLAVWPKINRTFRAESFYTTNDDTTTVKNEYMPKWVTKDPAERPDNLLKIKSGQGKITSANSLIAQTSLTVVISQVYFPGQTVLLDNSEVKVSPASDGLISVSVPQGKHEIRSTFRETPLRLAADLVSLLCFGIILWLLIR